MRVWNEMHSQDTRQTGQGIKHSLMEKMEGGIVHCTRGPTTIPMLWVRCMEAQAVRTTGRRWRKVGSVAVRAMLHVEGGLHVGGDSTGKRTCRVPNLCR